ncbi:MAG: lysylphosphatidylglycerol synthase transmembrane domain-containing protein [bacterium]|nr:lysylphosphatidylglycerol synthase transmembrane domain-containing protein [bacterium]
MKSLKKNSIILVFITLLILVLVLKDDFHSIMNAFLHANLLFILLALVCQIIGLVFDALAYKKVIDSYTKNYTMKKALRMIIITKFFNGITPFSSGGQPMQIYMLKKEGFRLTKATNIIIQTFILYQAALVLYGILAIIINLKFQLFKDIFLLKNLIIIGFLMNTLVMIGLVVISFSNKFNHIMIRKIISLLSKVHIVKDKEKKQAQWRERVDDFHEGATFLKKNKKLCFQAFIYNFLYLTFTYVMPYFVIIALSNHNLVTPINSIVASAYILIIGAFVPIPGASGGIEYGYLKFFGTFIQGSVLKASLLIWRFISYYLPMIVGAIVFNLKGSKKS